MLHCRSPDTVQEDTLYNAEEESPDDGVDDFLFMLEESKTAGRWQSSVMRYALFFAPSLQFLTI